MKSDNKASVDKLLRGFVLEEIPVQFISSSTGKVSPPYMPQKEAAEPILPRPVFLDEQGRWATWGELDDLHKLINSKMQELPGTLDQSDVYKLIGMHNRALELLSVMLRETKGQR